MCVCLLSPSLSVRRTFPPPFSSLLPKGGVPGFAPLLSRAAAPTRPLYSPMRLCTAAFFRGPCWASTARHGRSRAGRAATALALECCRASPARRATRLSRAVASPSSAPAPCQLVPRSCPRRPSRSLQRLASHGPCRSSRAILSRHRPPSSVPVCLLPGADETPPSRSCLAPSPCTPCRLGRAVLDHRRSCPASTAASRFPCLCDALL